MVDTHHHLRHLIQELWTLAIHLQHSSIQNLRQACQAAGSRYHRCHHLKAVVISNTATVATIDGTIEVDTGDRINTLLLNMVDTNNRSIHLSKEDSMTTEDGKMDILEVAVIRMEADRVIRSRIRDIIKVVDKDRTAMAGDSATRSKKVTMRRNETVCRALLVVCIWSTVWVAPLRETLTNGRCTEPLHVLYNMP